MSPSTAWRDEPPDLLARSQDDVVAAFFTVIEAIPAGRLFSVNDIRRQLDALEIPNASRGVLFTAARTAGLIEYAGGTAWGREYLDVERSTGRSAHGARVMRYRRCRPDVVGAP